MSISLAHMLQLTILLPLLSVIGVLATSNKPNLREAITLSTSMLLIYLVSQLYGANAQGLALNISWGEIIPGLAISFTVEPLGMLFAFVASFLWLITTCYAIGYLRCHHEKNQTRFYCCFAIAISAVMGLTF